MLLCLPPLQITVWRCYDGSQETWFSSCLKILLDQNHFRAFHDGCLLCVNLFQKVTLSVIYRKDSFFYHHAISYNFNNLLMRGRFFVVLSTFCRLKKLGISKQKIQLTTESPIPLSSLIGADLLFRAWYLLVLELSCLGKTYSFWAWICEDAKCVCFVVGIIYHQYNGISLRTYILLFIDKMLLVRWLCRENRQQYQFVHSLSFLSI